jgi:type IV secretory pathway VirJ component
MFGAEAESRGCVACFPSGGAVPSIDVVLVTPSGRKLAVQVKGQSTKQFSTVDLGAKDHGAMDLLAVFNAAQGGWFLIKAEVVANRRTITGRECRRYPANWNLLK